MRAARAYAHRAAAYQAAIQVNSVAPTQSTGTALAGNEGRVLELRSKDARRNSPLIAAGIEAWKHELRGFFEPQPDTDEASAAWAEWSQQVGYRHQYGTIAQLAGLWILKALEDGGAFVQRVRVEPSEYNPNGLCLYVRSMREIERGFGDGGLAYSQGATLAGVWFRADNPVRGIFSQQSQISRFQPEFVDIRDLAILRRPADTDTDDGEPIAHAAIVPDKILQELTLADMNHRKVAANITALAYSSRQSLTGRQLGQSQTPTMTGPNGESIERLAPGTAMVLSGVDGVVFPRMDNGAVAYGSHEARVAAAIGHVRQTIGGDSGKASMSAMKHATESMHHRGKALALDLGLPSGMKKLLGWFIEAELFVGRDWTDENWDFMPNQAIQIDPVKNVSAITMEVTNGFESKAGAIRRLGRDPRTVARENELMPVENNAVSA